MKRREPVENVMSSNVVRVDVSEKLSIVRDILRDASFHHVPIVDGETLVGIISTRDMMRLSLEGSGVSDAALDKSFSITEVMRRDPVTIDQGDSVQTAIDLLARGKFHSLPVVNDDGHLVGIVTSIDLLAYLMA